MHATLYVPMLQRTRSCLGLLHRIPCHQRQELRAFGTALLRHAAGYCLPTAGVEVLAWFCRRSRGSDAALIWSQTRHRNRVDFESGAGVCRPRVIWRAITPLTFMNDFHFSLLLVPSRATEKHNF